MAIDKKTFVGVFDSTNVNKFYNIYTSDATISELNEMSALPADALIISSPIYSNIETKIAYDLGIPAIVMTDSYGTPLALTHSFDPKTFAIDNTTNTVKVKEIAGLDSIVDSVRKELEEIKQSVSQTLEGKFTKLVQSRAVLPNNDGRTSLVSFIDNTTYELKLEKWHNQKMSINDSYNGMTAYTGIKSYTFVIPGLNYKSNAHKYIYANYNAYSPSLDSITTSKMEVSVCLSYVIHSSYIDSLLKGNDALKYSIENNNCFNYINSYFITNYYRDLNPPQSQTTQPSTASPDPTSTTVIPSTTSTTVIPTTTITTTPFTPNSSFTPPTSINVLNLFNREYSYVLNDIIGVADNSSYIITKDITMNGVKVGSYTFLKFPYDFSEHSMGFNFQIKEGFSYLSSNTCRIRLNWEWDTNDLPGDIYT